MNKYRFGDIYLVRFHPSVGQELKRYRPAVVLSSVVNRIDSRFVLVAAVSTKIDSTNKYEVVIDNTSLQKKSAILVWYLRTIDTERLERKIGELSKDDQSKCKAMVKNIFK